MDSPSTSTTTARSVFISHASKNLKVADEIRSILEARGVSCWIAPRDIQPGQQYGTSIIDGISNSTVFLLLLTHESNLSAAVQNEVERAFGYQKVIIPVRISDVKPGKQIEFFVSNAQWVDAIYEPLKRRMDEVASIVHAIEMSAKPPPVQPEKKTLVGSVEKFFERSLRHKTISFIAGFLILASLIVLGIYLQSRSMGALDQASTTIQQSGTEITAAATTIKDSSDKVSAFGVKVDVLKKETSTDPRKELANLGLAFNSDTFFQSINDPTIASLFIQGGMKVSLDEIFSAMFSLSMTPEALNLLMPGTGVEKFGDCPSIAGHMGAIKYKVLLEKFIESPKKRTVFTALCNSKGELTKRVNERLAALAKAGHDRKAIEAMQEKSKKVLTSDELISETKARNFHEEVEMGYLKDLLEILAN